MHVEVELADDGTVRMANGLRPVTQPSAATRSAIRRLVDEETLDAIVRAAAVVAAARPGAAIVNDALTLRDLGADWLLGTVVRLVQAVGVLSSDPLDNKSIGRGRTRKRLERVAERATEVADVYEFLSCFRGEILSEIWLPTVRAAIEAATHLQATLTADTDAVSAEACERYESVRHQFEEELYLLLVSTPHTPLDVLELSMPETLEEYLSEVLGIDARNLDGTATGAWIDRIRRSGLDPRAVAESRFAFLDSLDFGDEEFLRAYSYLAFRLASSEFPLLAHRALQLMSRLLSAADVTDQTRTRDLVSSFFVNEASWIVASAPAYEDAVRDFIDNGDPPAIVEALRRLSEGVLRPYGSLVAAVAEIPSSSAAAIPLVVAPTLGDLEQRLDRERSSIEALLLPLIRREWRNADAHARATVGPTGQLILRLDDGSVEEIDPNRVHGDVSMLRSALAGIDAAVNIFFVTRAMQSADPGARLPPLSREMIRNVVVEAVDRTVQGKVLDVIVSEERFQVTLDGRAARAELEETLALIGRMTMGQYPEVCAVNKKGKTLAKVVRLDAEPTRPFDQNYLPG